MTEEDFNFPMVSDPSGKIGAMYGVFDEDAGINHRGCFLIDPDGVLQVAITHTPPVGRSFHEIFRMLTGFLYVRKNPTEALPTDWTPGDITLIVNPAMVGHVSASWTTASMSIGKFKEDTVGTAWSNENMRIAR